MIKGDLIEVKIRFRKNIETLQRRGTSYDRNSIKHVVALAEDENMQKRWKYFLKNIKDNTLEFFIVITEIQIFLEPVFKAIVNEEEWLDSWKSRHNMWITNLTKCK
ncbi:MAG: hypothetical protein ACI4EG_05800 [Fusicatenibacter sp.]